MLHSFITWLLDIISAWGYWGIGILMMMESTVLPVPSELVLIPAGYLAQQGEMNVYIILLASTIGSWVGACINYFASLYVGRPFLERFGKYFFVKEKHLQMVDHFFEKYGNISTFTGRLLPVIRHLISIPAGLSKMPFWLFSGYTIAGAAIWSAILIALGYFLGDQQEVLKEYSGWITVGIIVSVIVLWVAYVKFKNKR